MSFLNKLLTIMRTISKYTAMTAILSILLVIVGSVALRWFGKPFTGQIELVELLMVILIMSGLSYAQSNNGHVEVGIIVDKLKPNVQANLDILACILIIFASFTVAFYNIQGLMKYMELGLTSMVLSIPLYPLKIVIAIGFFFWGIEAIVKLLRTIIMLKNNNYVKQVGEEM